MENKLLAEEFGLDDYQEFVRSKMRNYNRAKILPHNLMHWMLLLHGESGELAEIIKKATFYDRTPVKNIQGCLDIVENKANFRAIVDVEDFDHEVTNELGDILFAVTAIAAELNLSLDDIARFNVKKLEARHPNGFVGDGGLRTPGVVSSHE